jgi:hypothetical protein
VSYIPILHGDSHKLTAYAIVLPTECEIIDFLTSLPRPQALYGGKKEGDTRKEDRGRRMEV